MNRFYSRLAKKEENKSRRQIFFWVILTIILIFSLVTFSIPVLTRLSFLFSNNKTIQDTKENLRLAPPKLNFVPEATNSAIISFSGNTIGDSDVEIIFNNNQLPVIKAKDGLFKTEDLKLDEGTNTVYAMTLDSSGNKSQPSEKLTIVLKTTPPELIINQPTDKTAFIGQSQKNLQIVGQTCSDCSLTINNHLIVLGKNASFSSNYQLQEGDNSIILVAMDNAGNTTEKKLNITFSSN